MMARSKRMERGEYSQDPFYCHTHDCQGCEQECNGIEGRHIADDAKDIAGWTNDADQATAMRKHYEHDQTKPLQISADGKHPPEIGV